jgi:hypothetical protein
MLTLSVTSHASGPLLDGRAERAVDQACREAERKTATFGAAIIRARMDRTFKRQTPYYRLQNQARVDPPGWKISDAGVIYGPWLEGVGSRNRTTRFKGYFIYRRSVQEIQRHMERITDQEVSRALAGVGA